MVSVGGALVLLMAAASLAGCASGNRPGEEVTDETAARTFVATDLEGYWRCADDGSVTHITNVGLPTGGSGSFTPPGGAMIPDGKFRSIRFLGGNRWEAVENERARPGFVEGNQDPLAWRRVVIEMEDRHTIRVGPTVYRRQ